jgi:hypothetical protein
MMNDVSFTKAAQRHNVVKKVKRSSKLKDVATNL